MSRPRNGICHIIKRKCLTCNKIFYSFKSEIKRGRGKYCSRNCKPSWNKGKKLSKECRKAMSEGKKKYFKLHPPKGTVHFYGYILIRKSDHPRAFKSGYIPRSHLVMEKSLKRFLKKGEVVHHINGIKDDDRIENLKLFKNQSEHIKFENPGQYNKFKKHRF